MQFLNKSFFAIAASCAVIFSCSSDEPTRTHAIAGKLIASVDGASWISVQAAATIMDGSITVVGTDGGDGHITLTIDNTIVGSYAVEGESLEAIVSYNNGHDENEYASTYYDHGVALGSIVITQIDVANKTISGTFTCKVKRMVPNEEEVVITSGSFSKIPYESDVEPGGNTNNTFTANIAGVAFTPSMIGGNKALGSITLNFAQGSKAIIISVPDDATVGSHSLADGMIGDYYGMYYPGSGTAYESVSGTLQITSHNTSTERIEGAFSFDCEPFPSGGTAISVTNGTFAVSY